jgi:hypothetical protein
MPNYDPNIWQAALPGFLVENTPISTPSEGTKLFNLQIYMIVPNTTTHVIWIDPTHGNRQYVTMDDNYDVYFATPDADCTAMITFVQDGTGSRTATFHYNDDLNTNPTEARVKWVNGTVLTLSTAARTEDVMSLEWNHELNRYVVMYTLGCI